MSNLEIVSNTSDSKRLEIALKENFFRELDKVYDYEEIKDFSKNELMELYTDGKVSGVINKMINDSILVRVNRGKYKLAISGKNVDIKGIMREVLMNSMNEIQDGLSKVSAVELSDNDFTLFTEARETLKILKEKYDLFE
ncbi:hypothetical protein ACV3RL_16205 [Clostridium perfringens]|nr:hypothetical protein [Clostridium perfringens]MDU1569071.1 hypothetical protein [Clostridium sp.]MDU2189924.1 hypothetical protein [Klebsiella pneumoniae]ELC8355152.1 hypothetical protein [Clostridium perfringens]ELC8411731.1 hypothetical protein [Clostridium perfringens]